MRALLLRSTWRAYAPGLTTCLAAGTPRHHLSAALARRRIAHQAGGRHTGWTALARRAMLPGQAALSSIEDSTYRGGMPRSTTLRFDAFLAKQNDRLSNRHAFVS